MTKVHSNPVFIETTPEVRCQPVSNPDRSPTIPKNTAAIGVEGKDTVYLHGQDIYDVRDKLAQVAENPDAVIGEHGEFFMYQYVQVECVPAIQSPFSKCVFCGEELEYQRERIITLHQDSASGFCHLASFNISCTDSLLEELQDILSDNTGRLIAENL